MGSVNVITTSILFFISPEATKFEKRAFINEPFSLQIFEEIDLHQFKS
jgi:hypothetical protein